MSRLARSPACRGFTLIELVIVMSMIGLLLSIALPQYMAALERGRQQVLQSNLATMREAIDKFYGDRGRYPDTLEDLVTQRYLRAIPVDPFTETPTWVVVAPRDAAKGGVIDVQSTGTDTLGQPRRTAAPAASGDGAGTLVEREGGAATVVTAVAPSASSADADAARGTER
jgi:general secretion pathway protein G